MMILNTIDNMHFRKVSNIYKAELSLAFGD